METATTWLWSRNNCKQKMQNMRSPNVIFQGEHGSFFQARASTWICQASKKSSTNSTGLVRWKITTPAGRVKVFDKYFVICCSTLSYNRMYTDSPCMSNIQWHWQPVYVKHTMSPVYHITECTLTACVCQTYNDTDSLCMSNIQCHQFII
jgi:hypothetical protein